MGGRRDAGGDFLLNVCPRRLISHRARLTKLSSSTCRALISTPTCEGHLQIPHANTVLTAHFRHGLDAQIISIQPHPERPSVTLTTGEVVSADVIVGADGYIIRRGIMDAIHQDMGPLVTMTSSPTPSCKKAHMRTIRLSRPCSV